jgi:hypothetical protein
MLKNLFFLLVSPVFISCTAIATVPLGDITFQEVRQKGYLKDNPTLLEHFKTVGDWPPTDPRRFRYTAYRGLHFVEPQVDCPQEGCPDLTVEEFRTYYRRNCNYADACWEYIYIKDGNAYREVFSGPFWRSGLETRIPLFVSKQEQGGFPLCVEYKATYFPKRDEKPPNFDDRTERLITRFCWDDAQKIYTFNGVRAIAEERQIPPEVKK